MDNKEFFIDCDGMPVHAKLDFPKSERDSYPLLIIFHGFTGQMEERHIVAVKDAASRAGYAALRVDLYGHGASGGNFADHTILKWLNQAMELVAYAKKLPFVDKIFLAGHSQGGLTALMTAGMMPGEIAGLIPLSPATVEVYGARKGELFGVKFNPEQMEDEYLLPRKNRKLKPEFFLTLRLLPLERAVASYHGPVCLIHGTSDQTVPFDYAKMLAGRERKATGDFTFVPIAGADHNYTGDGQLDEVTSTVKNFLEKQVLLLQGRSN